MHPVLFRFGDITLYTYGMFVGLGFISALWFATRSASRYGIDPPVISDIFLVIIVSSILGARLLYVVQNASAYRDDPLSVFKFWNGGLVFYGGFIGALIATVLYCRIKKLAVWLTADLLAPAIALGHAVGRVGCFFAGCCYGKECHLPWAVIFHDPESLAPTGIELHPTQLYSVITNVMLFLFLLWLRKRSRFDGMVFWVYILCYGLLRSFVEFFRGDLRGTFLMDTLSFSQGVGILMSMAAVIMLIYLSGKHHARIKTQ